MDGIWQQANIVGPQIRLTCRGQCGWDLTINQSGKSQKAQDKYPTIHYFVTETCTLFFQNVALWDTGLYGWLFYMCWCVKWLKMHTLSHRKTYFLDGIIRSLSSEAGWRIYVPVISVTSREIASWLSYRSAIWQAHRLQRCRDACQICRANTNG